MSRLEDDLKFLYDDKGNPFVVHVSPELWAKLEATVMPLIKKLYPESCEEPVIPEPLKDWGMLKEYWDFPYPVESGVQCEHCGAVTEDWEADEPRVFRLKAANMGGLLRFECQKCGATITKRHFKDKTTFECKLPVK